MGPYIIYCTLPVIPQISTSFCRLTDKWGWKKKDQRPSSSSCCPRQDCYTYFLRDISSNLFLQILRTNFTDSPDILLQLFTILSSKTFVLISHLSEPISSIFTSCPTHYGHREQKSSSAFSF